MRAQRSTGLWRQKTGCSPWESLTQGPPGDERRGIDAPGPSTAHRGHQTAGSNPCSGARPGSLSGCYDTKTHIFTAESRKNTEKWVYIVIITFSFFMVLSGEQQQMVVPVPHHSGLPRADVCVASQHFEGGRLSSSVNPQQAEALTAQKRKLGGTTPGRRKR